jgi:hypothetical protein
MRIGVATGSPAEFIQNDFIIATSSLRVRQSGDVPGSWFGEWRFDKFHRNDCNANWRSREGFSGAATPVRWLALCPYYETCKKRNDLWGEWGAPNSTSHGSINMVQLIRRIPSDTAVISVTLAGQMSLRFCHQIFAKQISESPNSGLFVNFSIPDLHLPTKTGRVIRPALLTST